MQKMSGEIVETRKSIFYQLFMPQNAFPILPVDNPFRYK